MLSNKIRRLAIVSALVAVVAGCQSPALMTPAKLTGIEYCKPVEPQLEYYTVEEGGVYYPERSFINLMLYIEQLNDCIDYHQMRPG